jgi:F420H(2)-dependent quinone reductase
MSFFFRAVSALNVFVYRASGGRVLGHVGEARILLLTTKGRRSGKARTVPVLVLEDGERLVVVASKGGAPQDPAWFANLRAEARAEVELGARRFPVTAREAGPEEKARLWPRLVALYPPYEAYQSRTERPIPLVILTPV